MQVFNVLAFIFASCCCIHNLSASVIGAFFLPHGDIALDPTVFYGNATQKEQAWRLHNASNMIGSMIGELSPDLIFLSTPHGMADQVRFLTYLNSVGNGNAGEGFTKYDITVNLDADGSASFVSHMSSVTANVSGITAFTTAETFPLRWGEVIPLWFIKSSVAKAKVIIMSHPTRRYDYSVAMIPELLTLGREAYQYFAGLKEKVVIVISGDLAHTFDANGPYGYSPAAAPFDRAVNDWIITRDGSKLTKEAASYVKDALSCGYTGLVMLQGMLEKGGGTEKWKSYSYANFAPTYYGMAVASFIPIV